MLVSSLLAQTSHSGLWFNYLSSCASQILKEAKEDLRRVGSRISWRSRACLLVVARKAKTDVSNANVLDIKQRGVL
jgi:hypothetical protein